MAKLCVVLGNGPSLKGFDLNRLREVAALGMNAAYRYWDEINWYPDYYACLDDQMIESHHDEIYRLWREGLVSTFFVHSAFFVYHPDCICAPGFYSLDQVLPHWYKKRGQGQGWRDLTQEPAFNTTDTTKITTGAFAVRFAAYLGHDKLALMGIDLKYVEIIKEAEKTEGVGLVMRETPDSNPNYFFDSYQQAGDKYNIPNPDVHDNKLHIQAFQLIPTDFALRGQQTKIVNTNPKSLLEADKVFPLEPIDSVIAPHKMAAIVVPTTRFEIKAILENFDIWAADQYAPLLPGDLDSRTALVFMFNNDSAKQHEAEIRTRFDATQMTRFFSHVAFEYLGLEDDLDKYERDYSKKTGDHGYKSGPNNQFFRTMYKAQNLGRYVFQMETDCVPLRAGWLSALRDHVASSPYFWVLGSAYHGLETLSPAFKGHINGNAIYAVGDSGFQDFLKTFWEPRTHAMVKGVDKRLAYDCILEKVFTEQKSQDPEVAKVFEKYGDMFQFTEYMLNISGKKDLENLATGYESELLLEYETAYILHNRTAQERVSARIPKYLSATNSKLKVSPVFPKTLPRLLVLDMTAMGNKSATGEIKFNLLQDWPDDGLLQVAGPTNEALSLVRRDGDGKHRETRLDATAVRAAIAEFDAEVILYRPVADRPMLHDFAMELIGDSDVPLVTWIMDDWPARLQATDPALFAKMDSDLRCLFNQAELNLSICDAMSEAFGTRYGVAFAAYANGIDPGHWPTRVPHKSGPVVVRYAGGLAPDMNAASVQRVARAIEDLAAEGVDIHLEINTQPWWIKQSGALFDGLTATRLTSQTRPFSEYARWLQEADILLIAYNFDPESLRYVRYSMANKLPECLASGAALLVHGPQEVATVDYIARHGVGRIADSETADDIRTALRALCNVPVRQKLATAARDLVLRRHRLAALSRSLAAEIANLQIRGVSGAFDCYLIGQEKAAAAAVMPLAQLASDLDPEACAVITYEDPAYVLAAELVNKGDLDAALTAWQEQARASLALYYKARSQLSIIERSRITAAPLSYREMLKGLLPSKALPAQLCGKVSSPDPMLVTIAALYLTQCPIAIRLLAELRACGRRPEGITAQVVADPKENLATYQVLADLWQTSGQTRDLTRAQSRNSGLEETLGQSKKREQDLSGEIKLLKEQLTQLQATTEVYFKQAEVQRTELDRIYVSKSWRITEPLRGIRRSFSGNRDKD